MNKDSSTANFTSLRFLLERRNAHTTCFLHLPQIWTASQKVQNLQTFSYFLLKRKLFFFFFRESFFLRGFSKEVTKMSQAKCYS